MNCRTESERIPRRWLSVGWRWRSSSVMAFRRFRQGKLSLYSYKDISCPVKRRFGETLRWLTCSGGACGIIRICVSRSQGTSQSRPALHPESSSSLVHYSMVLLFWCSSRSTTGINGNVLDQTSVLAQIRRVTSCFLITGHLY